MFIPEENTTNAAIATATGVPATIFALSLSQGEIALIGLAVNVFLAFALKALDVFARAVIVPWIEERRAARVAAIAAVAPSKTPEEL
jgi:hypothetical protein